MYIAALGAGAVAALALSVRVLQSTHRRPGTGPGHPRHPLPQVVLGVLTLLIRTSLRLGIRLGPMMMLTVPGRRSGLPRTNPVDLWTGEGRSFLVATHTEHAAWVANLRAARGGTLWRGRRRWSFTAIELPPEDAAAVLKNVLGPRLRRPIAGFVLRRTLAVSPDAPIGAFVDAAKTHPVFELTLTPSDTPGPGPRPAAARQTA
jgi:deazaflavin-dependent oxidoreductase (nitroreductase family)